MTQCEKVIDFMQKNGSITARDALGFGCMRLASRISDIKRSGVPIVTEMETSKNIYGEKVSYARYSLGERSGLA